MEEEFHLSFPYVFKEDKKIYMVPESSQGNQISKWGKNVYVKVPVCNSKGKFMGKVIKKLNTNNIKLNITAVYSSKQTNHPNLVQNIYSFSKLVLILKKKKYKLIFKSRNEDKYIACRNKKFKTYSFNLLFKK